MSFPIITVFGSAKPVEGEPAYRLAMELGAAIAREGWTLCNGGYGGTMEASARGAADAGGETVGVTCRAFGRSGPNAFVRRVIETADLTERVTKLVELGQAYVVLPGGTGTLLELALVWELRNKRLLPDERPVIVLGNFWRPVLETVGPQTRRESVVERAADIPAAIELLKRCLG